jgi:hypothetical protein
MKNEKEFCEELEALMIKYEVDQSISIFPMEGKTRICSYSIRKEEEPYISEVFIKFAETIGKIDTESISQVTWETIAYQNAEELLSEEDYENLENAQILKNAAIQSNEWEYAARYREEELSLLSKVMRILELKDPIEDTPNC